MSEETRVSEELIESEAPKRVFKNDGEPTTLRGVVTHNPIVVSRYDWNGGNGTTITYDLTVQTDDGTSTDIVVDVLHSEDRPSHDQFVEAITSREPISVSIQKQVEIVKDHTGREVAIPASSRRTFRPAKTLVEEGESFSGFATL